MVLRERALKGDARALDRLLELALRFNNDEAGQAQQPCPPMTKRSSLRMWPSRGRRQMTAATGGPATIRRRNPAPASGTKARK